MLVASAALYAADAVPEVLQPRSVGPPSLHTRRPAAAPEVGIGSEFRRNRWFLFISDNGEGIPIEQRERIFAPLSRLHGQNLPGTGLGLAVCKIIIERLGGRIWVDSIPGQGSTFHFSLPAATA
jgi:signal transduction histidine kinase